MNRLTQTQLAAHLGVSQSAISRAITAGRLTADADGLLDPVAAAAQWEHNRRRRQRMPRPGAAEASIPAATAAPDYWKAKAARETAEAAMAQMREREMAGELVRRAVIERELAGRLIALREALEGLGDRLGPLLAAEDTPVACRHLVLTETRRALAAFAERLQSETDPEPDPPEPSPC